MKSFLSLILAIALLSVVLSGCGGPTTTSKDISSENESSSTRSDLGFGEISTESKVQTASSSPVQGGWAGSKAKYTAEQMDQPYSLRKNIKGNVKIFNPFASEDTFKLTGTMFKQAYPQASLEIIPAAYVSRNEKLTALVASGNSPDYVYSGYDEYPFRAVKKLTIPIGKYMQPHPADNVFLMDNYASYKGERYCVVWNTPPYVLWYNKTMFENKGVKTPRKYYEENNWTLDTFKQVAKQMTDSSKGVYGFATDVDWFFPASAGQDVIRFEKGKAVLNIVGNSKFTQAYQFFLDMILIDKSAKQQHWMSYEDFRNGKLAMYFAPAAHNRLFGTVKHDFAPFPKKDKSSPYVTATAALNGGFSVAAGSKNIEGAMAYGEMSFNAEIKFRKGNMNQPVFRDIYNMSQKENFQYVTSWAIGYGLNDLFNQQFQGQAREGKKDLNTIINEYAPLLNAKISDMQK